MQSRRAFARFAVALRSGVINVYALWSGGQTYRISRARRIGISRHGNNSCHCVRRVPDDRLCIANGITARNSVEQLEENLKAGEVTLSDAEWKDVEAAIAGRPAGSAKATRKRGTASRKRK